MIPTVRTTLDIDADVLQAAKEIAANRRTTTGKVITELARKALQPTRAAKARNGVPAACSQPGAPACRGNPPDA